MWYVAWKIKFAKLQLLENNATGLCNAKRNEQNSDSGSYEKRLDNSTKNRYSYLERIARSQRKWRSNGSENVTSRLHSWFGYYMSPVTSTDKSTIDIRKFLFLLWPFFIVTKTGHPVCKTCVTWKPNFVPKIKSSN